MAKKNQPELIYSAGISVFIYTFPVCLLLFCLIFLVLNGLGTVFYLLIGCSIISFISNTPTFLGRRIVLTKYKLYIFQGKTKLISWTIIGDFDGIDYKQSKLGKFFDYGDLYFTNIEGKVIQVKAVKNCLQAFEKIVLHYEKLAKEVDPTYIETYKKGDINKKNIIIKDGKKIEIDRIEDTKNEE